MLTGVGTVTVQVTDQDRALEFYTRQPGFEVRSDQPMAPGQRWLEAAPPGARTRILLYRASPDQPGAGSYDAARARIGGDTGMVLEVDDIEATFRDLEARGVTVVTPPEHREWGWWGVFADRDGNTYGVHA